MCKVRLLPADLRQHLQTGGPSADSPDSPHSIDLGCVRGSEVGTAGAGQAGVRVRADGPGSAGECVCVLSLLG